MQGRDFIAIQNVHIHTCPQRLGEKFHYKFMRRLDYMYSPSGAPTPRNRRPELLHSRVLCVNMCVRGRAHCNGSFWNSRDLNACERLIIKCSHIGTIKLCLNCHPRCARALTSRCAIMGHLNHTYRNVLLIISIYMYINFTIHTHPHMHTRARIHTTTRRDQSFNACKLSRGIFGSPCAFGFFLLSILPPRILC